MVVCTVPEVSGVDSDKKQPSPVQHFLALPTFVPVHLSNPPFMSHLDSSRIATSRSRRAIAAIPATGHFAPFIPHPFSDTPAYQHSQWPRALFASNIAPALRFLIDYSAAP
jgi:hypothetical protein